MLEMSLLIPIANPHRWMNEKRSAVLFHHQSSHRGQITTLISQLGDDFGGTDRIYMPGARLRAFLLSLRRRHDEH